MKKFFKPFEKISNKEVNAIYLEANYVPYQKCPICEGTGIITIINSNPVSALYQNTTCDICNGAKIIPMHKVK